MLREGSWKTCKPNLYLVRHGESQGNVDHDIYRRVPDHEVLLTDKGKAQAVEAGQKLRNIIPGKVAVYKSPYWRCRQTAEGILKAFDPTDIIFEKEDPRLREQSYGNFASEDNRDASIQSRIAYGKFFYKFPNGESGADCYDRMDMFLHTLHRDLEKHEIEDVLIVSHGISCRALITRLLHLSFQEFDAMYNINNCEIVKCVYNRDMQRYTLATPVCSRPVIDNYPGF